MSDRHPSPTISTTQTSKFEQAIAVVEALSQDEQALLLDIFKERLEDYFLEKRRQKGWELARAAAKRLREELGATRVLAFGSLICRTWHNPSADVELAAWGIPDVEFMKGYGIALDSSPEILVELVDLKICSEWELQRIERGGIEV